MNACFCTARFRYFPYQATGKRLRNDLFCVEWDEETQHSQSIGRCVWLQELTKMFNDSDSFYYCQHADVTSTVQRRHHCHQQQQQLQHGECDELAADDRFFWNKHMLAELIDCQQVNSIVRCSCLHPPSRWDWSNYVSGLSICLCRRIYTAFRKKLYLVFPYISHSFGTNFMRLSANIRKSTDGNLILTESVKYSLSSCTIVIAHCTCEVMIQNKMYHFFLNTVYVRLGRAFSGRLLDDS